MFLLPLQRSLHKRARAPCSSSDDFSSKSSPTDLIQIEYHQMSQDLPQLLLHWFQRALTRLFAMAKPFIYLLFRSSSRTASKESNSRWRIASLSLNVESQSPGTQKNHAQSLGKFSGPFYILKGAP
jgi:hypothetical protein